MNSSYQKLPMSWVERIFERLEMIYKDRWLPSLSDERKSLLKIVWSSALIGLSADEIRCALSLFQSYPHLEPPTHMEFFHYAKGKKQPYIKPTNSKYERGNPEVASKYLSEIKSKLKYKCST
jgi:hypothetical protein